MGLYTQSTNIGFNQVAASCMHFIHVELYFYVSEPFIVTPGSVYAGILVLECTLEGNLAVVPSPPAVLWFAFWGDRTNRINFG